MGLRVGAGAGARPARPPAGARRAQARAGRGGGPRGSQLGLPAPRRALRAPSGRGPAAERGEGPGEGRPARPGACSRLPHAGPRGPRANGPAAPARFLLPPFAPDGVGPLRGRSGGRRGALTPRRSAAGAGPPHGGACDLGPRVHLPAPHEPDGQVGGGRPGAPAGRKAALRLRELAPSAGLVPRRPSGRPAGLRRRRSLSLRPPLLPASPSRHSLLRAGPGVRLSHGRGGARRPRGCRGVAWPSQAGGRGQRGAACGSRGGAAVDSPPRASGSHGVPLAGAGACGAPGNPLCRRFGSWGGQGRPPRQPPPPMCPQVKWSCTGSSWRWSTRSPNGRGELAASSLAFSSPPSLGGRTVRPRS